MPSNTLRYERLLEAVPDALVGVDQNGIVRFVNSQTEMLFGYDRDELIGEPIDAMVSETLWRIYTVHRQDYFADPRTRSSGLEVELGGRHHNGSQFPINISMSEIDTGDVLLVITAAGDVAEQQRAVKNAGLTSAIVEYADDAIIGTTLDGKITSWNPAAERMYRHSSREVVGRSLGLLTPSDRAGQSMAFLARISAGQAVEHLETTGVRKDGTMVPVSITVSGIRDAEGTVVGASTVHRDVTEQRKAFEIAQRMAAIIEDSDEAIISASLDGVLTSWNPAAERMYGYCADEIIGRSAELVVSEDESGVVQAVLEQIAAGKHVEDLVTKGLRKDGAVFPVTVTVSPIRDADRAIVGASAVARDTTEQRRTFEAAQLMEAIVHNSEDAIASITPDGILTSWNPAAERLFGYSRQEIVGNSVDFLRPRDRADETHDVLAKIKAGQPVQRYETYRLRKDGTPVPVSLTASPIRDADGAFVGVSAIYRDLTQARQAFEATQRLAAIVESSDDAIIGKTLDGIVTSWNRAAATMYGYSSQEMIGKPVYLLSPPERTGEIETILAKIRSGETVEHFETDRIRRDGTVFPVSITVSPIRDPDGEIIGASTIARDVSAR